MKLLAFAASNSRNGINRALVTYAVSVLKAEVLPDAEVTMLDINDFEMPIYSIDRENENGVPDEAHAFLAAIGAADAILVSFAEHNSSVAAAWKNIFDWMSRVEKDLWQHKPVAMLAATPGGRAGAGVLGYQEAIAPRFSAEIRGTLGLGKWGETWDAENQCLRNSEDADALKHVLTALCSDGSQD